MEFVRGSNAIIHSALSTEIDFDHKKALNIVLQDCTDEQIVAEFAQRIADRKHLKRVQKVNEKYHFERLLAKGTSSKVHLVYHKETGVGYACKSMEWSTQKELALINAQIDAMKTANHEFVISLFEYFKSSKCIWLIMELTNSVPLRGMLKRLDADGKQSESFVDRSITQILQGVEYLHSMGIVHRDLKIDNIFYQGDISTGKIKISSFGLSTTIKSGTKDCDLKNFAGLKERWGTGIFNSFLHSSYFLYSLLFLCSSLFFSIF
jgi:serine/threonine protein kinase